MRNIYVYLGSWNTYLYTYTSTYIYVYIYTTTYMYVNNFDVT